MGSDGWDHRWCTECGAEHESWATRCAFCGAPLGAERPPDPPHLDHSIAELDVASLGASERHALALLLRSAEVPHELRGGSLRVPTTAVGDAETAIDAVQAPSNADESELALDGATARADPASAEMPRFATTGRRVLARLFAWVVLTIVAAFLWWLFEPSFRVPFTELVILMELALIARFGWDLGKALFGMDVVDAHGSVPGWGRAMIRTLVLWGPILVLDVAAQAVEGSSRPLASALAIASVAWWPLLVVSIATHPEHRGWHDRAAGTWVLCDRDAPGVRVPEVAGPQT